MRYVPDVITIIAGLAISLVELFYINNLAIGLLTIVMTIAMEVNTRAVLWMRDTLENTRNACEIVRLYNESCPPELQDLKRKILEEANRHIREINNGIVTGEYFYRKLIETIKRARRKILAVSMIIREWEIVDHEQYLFRENVITALKNNVSVWRIFVVNNIDALLNDPQSLRFLIKHYMCGLNTIIVTPSEVDANELSQCPGGFIIIDDRCCYLDLATPNLRATFPYGATRAQLVTERGIIDKLRSLFERLRTSSRRSLENDEIPRYVRNNLQEGRAILREALKETNGLLKKLCRRFEIRLSSEVERRMRLVRELTGDGG